MKGSVVVVLLHAPFAGVLCRAEDSDPRGDWPDGAEGPCSAKCGGGTKTIGLGCSAGAGCSKSVTLMCNTQPCDGSCFHRSDGLQKVNIAGVEVTAVCRGGWTIMRTDLDAGWMTKTYFASHGRYSTNAGDIYGPSYEGVMRSDQDQTRADGWFNWPGEVMLGTSDDCDTVTRTDHVGYYATGNYMPSPIRGHCVYYNRNCDELSNGTCFRCNDDWSHTPHSGTCSHWTRNASEEFPFHEGNCHHWWNRFPSATAENARYCMAFKQKVVPAHYLPNYSHDPEACYGREDGVQTLHVKGYPRKASCHEGWTIMRTDLDAGWMTDTYFTGFGKYSTNSGDIYGPSYSLLMQPNMDNTRTSGWFTKSGIIFGTSDDCTTMSSKNNVGYYATGNYMPSPSRGHCVYWNRNCDELPDGTCRMCKDNWQGNQHPTPGTCSHETMDASVEYPFHENDCHHWWNRFPSTTAEKPKYCLAYRNGH